MKIIYFVLLNLNKLEIENKTMYTGIGRVDKLV